MLRNARAGLGLIYSMLLILALCAMASLAVDMGRVVMVKTQLCAAADAAALAAAQHVLSDTNLARSDAVTVAAANQADGAPVTLNSISDVEIIHWDPATRTYQPASITLPANAVKVTAHRSAARGNPVTLAFASVLGSATCDVNASAIALATPTSYAAVGLDFITMGGNATNAYRSNNIGGIPSGNFTSNGSIASNGTITLTGSSLINGNAYPGVGHIVIGANHVTGTTSSLNAPLVFPVADPGNAAASNNNGALPSFCFKNGSVSLGNNQSANLPGGVYYLRDFTMNAGSSLTFSGPATIYLTGNLALGGNAVTNALLPKNLRICLLSPGTTVSLSGGSDLFADIYAPLSAITISGNGDIYGSIVGKSLAMTGEAGIHYDMSLTGGISLVK